jgi:hypothetical protein
MAWVEHISMEIQERLAFGELFASTYEAEIARLTSTAS